MSRLKLADCVDGDGTQWYAMVCHVAGIQKKTAADSHTRIPTESKKQLNLTNQSRTPYSKQQGLGPGKFFAALSSKAISKKRSFRLASKNQRII